MPDLFFDSWESLGRTLLAGVIAYVALVVFLRISGKRTLAKMNAFDFVVTIAIGSTLASLFTSRDLPIVNGVLALALLIGLQYAVASAARAWHPFERALKSRPRALFRDGGFDEEAMKEERVTRDEVLAAVRKHGFGDLNEVRIVSLEADGSMSVIAGDLGTGARSTLQNVANSDRGKAPIDTPGS